MERSGSTFADHTEGTDVSADRGHCRGGYHVAPGAARRPAKLGLPFLLAAGRDVYALGPDELWVLRRGEGMARLALARAGGRSRPGADHVRARRRAPADRVGSAMAARV